MQFNNTTDINGIIQLCEDYTNLGNTGISGNATLLKKFTAYANETNREIWSVIFNNYGGWQYDDSNQTDLPIATTALVEDQATYPIPSGSYTIRHIEWKDTSGVWNKLQPLTTEQIADHQALSEFEKTPGNPKYYTMLNDTVTLYPAPDFAQADSLRVHFDRGSHDFVSSDTTATSGFIPEFHGVIPVGASMRYWFAKPQGTDAYNKLAIEYEKMKSNIGKYYSQKFKEKFPPKVSVKDYLKENL
jgi:hypothetical protein